MWREVRAFLVKQNALALAIGVVVGGALDTVVKALVNGLFMPLVAPLQSATAGDYTKLTWAIGPFRFAPGIVMEGGSIDVNGAGTVLTTEQCRLHPNRNPSLTRPELEAFLLRT